MVLNKEELARYSQQIKLNQIGLAGQLQLKNAKVLCVGAGGLGSSLLYYLAAAGVGTIGIIDHDEIELSNLSRQILYQPKHVGEKKVVIAKDQLLAFNPDISLHIYNEKFGLNNAEQIVKNFDIVADCSDNFETRYLVNDICFYLNIPFVYASIYQFRGQVSFFSGMKGPCIRCLFPSSHYFVSDCGNAGVLGLLPGLLGMIQGVEIIKWILKLEKNLQGKLLTLDLLSMNFEHIELTLNPECELCVHHKHWNELNSENGVTWDEIKQKPKDSFVLIDVRSEEEHHVFNIGGICIPLNELTERSKELDSRKTIIVYCQSGQRSIQAMHLLKKQGFKSVRYLQGGIRNVNRAATVRERIDAP